MSTKQSYDGPLLAEIARIVKSFEEQAYDRPDPKDASPLYAQLCAEMITDPDILALMAEADRHQQITHLLFGAVHYLLLSGIQHPLIDFYPDLCADPRPKTDAYPYFRSFCLEHVNEIYQMVTTRRVQTNEVWRCTALPPAFGIVAQHSPQRPLALLEIGPSAGLNLLWDKYGYDYGAAGYLGDRSSPVQLPCALRGRLQPPLPQSLPTVSWRAGIDLMPINVQNEQEMLWIRALIWPEQMDRVRHLEQAIQVARQQPPRLVKGNALDLLPSLLAEVPQDALLCIYHSYALNQMPKAVREGIFALLAEHAQARNFFRISMEWYVRQPRPTLLLFSYLQGSIQEELLATSESHGRWLEWLQGAEA